jgi:uncharacterized Fe-S cluster-containing radical SAM superfamily protein
MKSVLLVNPYRDYKRYLPAPLQSLSRYTATLENLEELWQPADMAYLIALLRKSCNAAFLDAHLYGIPAESIDFGRYDTVAVSTAPYEKWRCTQIFFRHALDVLERAKRSGCRTVIYGPHPTVAPEEFSEVDAVLVGEPEGGIEEAVHSSRKGVFAPEPVMDLDTLPEPEYSIFNRLRYDARIYFEGRVRGNVAMIIGSRGCPYACSFCFKAMVTSQVRYHSPGYILSVAERLVRELGCRVFVFDDLTFTLNREWTLELLKGLKPLQVRFAVSTRADRLDEEMVSALARSGCVKIEIGVETASDENLAGMGKNITWAQARDAVLLCRKHRIPVISAFRMIFVPGETRASIGETLAQCRALGLDTFPNICTPYPGTPLWDMGVKEGKIRGDAIHWEDAVLAAGTVGTDFSREEIASISDSIAWKSHRPYLQSVMKYGRTYGYGKLFGKIARTAAARFQKRKG